VKTISLTETAYQRLLAWKEGRTFSEVIEELVPRKGTLEAAIKASQSLPRLQEKDFSDLESAVNATRGKLSSSWS
jgi:predicted CopG family antitoxin